MRNFSRLAAGAAVLATAFSLAACSNSERASDKPPRGDTVTPVSGAPSAAGADESESSKPTCTADDVKVSGSFGQQPKVTVPRDCRPPERLLKKDLVPGHGTPIKPHDTAVVDYQLTTWSDGKTADGNFGSGKPFPVRNVGSAQVIEGWNKGLIGAKQGARRLLVVPPDMGYGSAGQGPIKPDETLIFVIDVQQITH